MHQRAASSIVATYNNTSRDKKHWFEPYCTICCLMISYFLQACLISSYLPTVPGIRLYTGKTGKILIAQLNKFGTVSHTQLLLFFTHRTLLVWVSVRQLDGLLPVKLHVRTGGGRTLLPNIALHSGDSLLLFFFLFGPLLLCSVQR